MMRPAISAYECGLVQPIARPAHIAGGHLRQQPDASGLMGRPDIGRDLGAFAKGDTVSDAWMPGATRVQKVIDGGALKGGAPRALWRARGADPPRVSARSAAEWLIPHGRARHPGRQPRTARPPPLSPLVAAGRL